LPGIQDETIADAPRFLFAYGTLTPDGPEAEARGGWLADSVRGRLFDLGSYPTLVDLGDPSADWAEGFVRAVGSVLICPRPGLHRPDRTGRV